MTEFYTNAVKELKNIYENLNRKYYNNETICSRAVRDRVGGIVGQSCRDIGRH